MADIFGNTQPPAWLTRMTEQQPGLLGDVVGDLVGGLANASETAIDRATKKQAQGINTNWIKELPGSIKPGLAEARLNSTNPLWRIQAQQTQLNLAQQGLAMQNQQSLIDARKTQLQMTQHDQEVLPKWLQDHPTWESRQDAAPPQLFTSQARQMWNDVLMRDSQSIQQKALVESNNQFAKGVSDLLPDDPQTAGRLGAKINSGRITQQDWTELSTALNKAKASKEQKPTAAIQDVNQIAEWEKQADAAEASGDTKTAKDLRAKVVLLQEQLKGQQTIVGWDDQNRPIVVTGKGATLPTVSTQSMAQGKLLQYENATQLMNYLQQNLTDEHVGLRGAAGEFLVDRTLAQFVPGAANKERVKARTSIIALREGLMREMSDDRTGRFTRQDRDEIAKALPSDGIFESKERATEAIGRVREILSDRARVYSGRLGQPPPAWSLSKDEIIKMYQDGVASKLDPNSPDFKKKYLTKEEAIDALTRFH